MFAWLKGRGPVEYQTPAQESLDPIAAVPPSPHRLIAAALAEIDHLLNDPSTDGRMRDGLLDVRLALHPPVPVIPGRTS